MELKDKIKELRIKNCMTQDQLAERLNVSRQTVSKYELGINEPSIEVLKEMCVIFDCKIDDLITIDNPVIEEKRNKVNKILSLVVVSLLLFGLFLVFTFIRFLPDTIPMHYDVNFVPDRYGSKFELLAVSLIMILPLIFVLLNFVIRNEYIEQLQFKHFKLFMNITAIVVEAVFVIVMIIICSISLEEPFKYLSNILATLLGGLFLILSVFSSPLFNKKINPMFGYRTRTSLKNIDNWKKLNTCQSISGGISSLVIIILGLTIVTEYAFAFVTLLILSIIPTFIYQVVLNRRASNIKE